MRGKIADWYVQQQGLKLTRYRTLTALSKGQTPGPESSIIKIVAAPKMQDMGAFAMELMGPAGIMKEEVPHAAGFQAQWIGGAGFRIAGGTDEILRNIVAERVLGLPADVRVDKDVPFNQLGKKSLAGPRASRPLMIRSGRDARSPARAKPVTPHLSSPKRGEE